MPTAPFLRYTQDGERYIDASLREAISSFVSDLNQIGYPAYVNQLLSVWQVPDTPAESTWKRLIAEVFRGTQQLVSPDIAAQIITILELIVQNPTIEDSWELLCAHLDGA